MADPLQNKQYSLSDAMLGAQAQAPALKKWIEQDDAYKGLDPKQQANIDTHLGYRLSELHKVAAGYIYGVDAAAEYVPRTPFFDGLLWRIKALCNQLEKEKTAQSEELHELLQMMASYIKHAPLQEKMLRLTELQKFVQHNASFFEQQIDALRDNLIGKISTVELTEWAEYMVVNNEEFDTEDKRFLETIIHEKLYMYLTTTKELVPRVEDYLDALERLIRSYPAEEQQAALEHYVNEIPSKEALKKGEASLYQKNMQALVSRFLDELPSSNTNE